MSRGSVSLDALRRLCWDIAAPIRRGLTQLRGDGRSDRKFTDGLPPHGGGQGRNRDMPPRASRSAADCVPFDFTSAMWMLCDDITNRLDELLHIDMSRVAVSYAQTRTRALHGLQAKLTPMRFEHGATVTHRRGRQWTCQRLMLGQREMLYILTFYLPRFQDQPFHEKMVTVLHELFHVSPEFNGDIRRFGGRYHVHSHSQKEYDREMGRLAKKYIAMGPPRELYEWLGCDFRTLHKQTGGIRGQRIPIPKLIPLAKSA